MSTSGGKPRRPRAGARGATPAQRPAKKKPAPARRTAPDARAALPIGPLRLGAIPGATPGKWIDTWKERMPRHPLELVPLAVADQEDALRAGVVDAAIVRLPVDREAWHAFSLYDELPVVVFGVDSHLGAADELALADLEGEVRFVPSDDVLDVPLPGTVPPAFSTPLDTAEAIETVASGAGIVVVPMSLARLHHRRDVTYRPLRGGPLSPVGFAWPRDDASPLVDVLVGIVRGRSARSSR
ncbi:LysR substrate-binding domain-containing protein [Microbacterium sp. NPDC089189]|uniref:LysR substrate-binding domain-containing protein n=1 Tax=Microbacterium sp. NPDC089189 TaxID=3154972 RepID=UPI003443601D